MQTGLKVKLIRNKLIFTSLLATGLAVLFLMAIDVNNTRQRTYEQLSTVANIVASNAGTALTLNDPEQTTKALTMLKINGVTVNAQVLDEKQQIFASYQGQARDEAKAEASWLSTLTSLTEVEVTKPVMVNALTIGTLVINADTTSVWGSLISQWLLKLAVLSTLLLMAYSVLRDTSNYVLGPIQRLTKAIKGVVNSGDYSLRVEETAADELGELTKGFNLMLSQIEDRDSQLQQSNEALAQVQEPIVLRDADLKCEYVNPAFTALFGYELGELKGKTFSLSNGGQKKAELSQAEVYGIAKEQGVYRGEAYRKTKAGKVLPIERHISPVRDQAGEIKGYVTVLSDVTEKKHAEEVIWRQANFDALTGLPNRLMFTHRLKLELSKVDRSKLPLALMFLDLDHFKEINDTLGHDMGDQLLKEASKRIVSCLRGADGVGYIENVARLGGDEFTVVLSELTDTSGAELVANRILDKLAQPFQLGKEVVHISASIGIVETHPHETIDTDTLIKHADIAMYDAKQNGRNRFSHFSKEMLMETQKRRRLVSDIHKALENDEFYLEYQPIVDIQSNEIFKAEALIRWRHPIEGLINPDDFISVAEDSGLIVKLGDWVFYEAAQQVARWRKTLHKDFQISINKSPIQLNMSEEGQGQSSWFDYLKAIDLPGESIIVEITEGVFLNKNSLVSEKLHKFRQAGMQISLDDFGTGYSSLSYLLKFDIDYIKIDRSFVQNLSTNAEDMVLCEAMIVMAHKLGIEVVAEGIETQVQLGMLSNAGCNYGQGYLLSRPLSASDFERMHANKGLDNHMLIT